MLFAAGFGTRMGALTQDRPKPLLSVAGKPLLEHALKLSADIPTRVVNAHYKADQIVAFCADRAVQVSVETPEILDTGGGLRHALALLGADPVFTLNTDAIWRGPNGLDLLAKAWRPAEMDALLLCVPRDKAVGRLGPGDFHMTQTGRLQRGGDLVYTGAQILHTDRLDHMPETAFSLNRIWSEMAQDNRLFGLVYPGQWCDVGHPNGLRLAEEMLSDV
jgi:MurNAc alpha-1-phosphate uridylyltransferase